MTITPNWRKDVYLIFFGQFLYDTLTLVVTFFLIWYLSQTTESATILTLQMLLAMIPGIVLSPFAGVIIDRVNRKTLLLVSNLLVAVASLLIFAIGINSIILIFLFSLIRPFLIPFTIPTIQSSLPTMVPMDELTKVNGKFGMMQFSGFLIGPTLAIFLFDSLPINYLPLLNVLGAGLYALCLLAVRIPQVASEGEKVNFLTDSKLGLQKLRERRGLWYIALIFTLTMFFMMPIMALYPLMIMGFFGGTVAQAGIVEIVFSFAGILGGGLIGFFGNWKDRIKPLLMAFFIAAVTILGSGLLPGNPAGFWVFAGLNVIFGFTMPFFNTLVMTMMEQSFESEVLGRVMGIFASLQSIGGPIGLLFAGPLADQIGVQWLFVIAGLATLVCGLLILAIPKARNYDKQLQAQLHD